MFDKKKAFTDLVKTKYKNLNEFAQVVNQDVSGVYKLVNTDREPKINTMFLYAKTLECDIDDILNIFYHEDFIATHNNKDIVVEKSKTNIFKRLFHKG